MSNKLMKPTPVPDPVSLPYFEGLRQEKLLIQQCNKCAHRQHYPRPFCLNCLSTEINFYPDKSNPTLYSYTIVRTHFNKSFNDELTIIVVLVELEGGVRILSTLHGIAPDPAVLKIGMPLKLFFDHISDTLTLPRFRTI